MMKAQMPILFRLAPVAILAMTTASRGEILVSESFTGYVTGDLNGQATRATGLAGNWSGGSIHHKVLGTGLAMTGVHSSGGSVNLASGGNFTYRATAALASVLPVNVQLYGCYLFTTTTHTNARTVGSLALGSTATNNDGNASFVWAGNGYNSSNATESPGVRAQGTNLWSTPSVQLVAGETYLMVFAFSGQTQQTTAWVLNQAQITHQLAADTLDPATLSAAVTGTGEAEVVWTGTQTAATALGAMSYLHLFGLQSSTAANASFSFTWDEFRVSDISLRQAVTDPGAPPPDAYSTWRANFPEMAGESGDPLEDHDGDGIVNLLEFVLGGDPILYTTGIYPQETLNEDSLVFNFLRTTASQGGPQVEFRWSADLVNWTSVAIGTVNSGPHAGGVSVLVTGESVEVRVPRTNAAGGKLYGKLAVTQP